MTAIASAIAEKLKNELIIANESANSWMKRATVAEVRIDELTQIADQKTLAHDRVYAQLNEANEDAARLALVLDAVILYYGSDYRTRRETLAAHQARVEKSLPETGKDVKP